METYIFPSYELPNEREGYQVEIRYLILRGFKFSNNDREGYIRSMMSKCYYDMATREQIGRFIDGVVKKANKEFKDK